MLRAELLTTKVEFAEACRNAQRIWNQEHGCYRVPTEVDDQGIPVALSRDYPPVHDAFERSERARERAYLEQNVGGSAKDYFEEMGTGSYERRDQEPILRAHDDWEKAVWRLAEEFFPASDFPVLSEDIDHPASAFLGSAVASRDVRTITSEVDRLIDARLDVSWNASWEGDPMMALGLYPGVTANDIRDAAPEIADRVNKLYQDRLPLARIVALRAGGLTSREIGDRMGMTTRAVKDALALVEEK